MTDTTLAGTVAVITGSTRGIGRETALALGRAGAAIVGGRLQRCSNLLFRRLGKRRTGNEEQADEYHARHNLVHDGSSKDPVRNRLVAVGVEAPGSQGARRKNARRI